MFRALKDRDYRLLWIGQAVSYLGDQFHLVALPWLVLQLTHDPLQLGFVLAAAGIPRAALMLVGGAWADRFSPRSIMLVSDALRALITAGLIAAIVSGHVQLWMVYGLAIAFGVVSGFFMPAAEAAVPRLLPSADLESGNSLIMGVNQVATFVGPALAGVIIAWLGGAAHAGATAGSLSGIAIALSVDAASFLFSAVTLWMMRPIPGLGSTGTHPLHDVAEGLRFVGKSQMLRWLVTCIALGNFCVIGPLLVGVPVLASTRFPQGAAAFGIIVSASGLGSLIGMVAAGSLPRPSAKAFGLLAPGMFVLFGVAYAALGVVSSAWVAAGLMVVAGLGNGYVAILVITAMQRLTPKELLGRVMSLVMLGSVGLAPLSMALAGALMRVSVEGMFALAGAGMLATGALAFARRNIWHFPDIEPAEQPLATGDLEAA